jgi:leader peptidase (prepilin peptidase)/N-methyltransferase
MQDDRDDVHHPFPEVGVSVQAAASLTILLTLSFAAFFALTPHAMWTDDVTVYASIGLASALLLLSYIDLRTGLLPDLLTLPLGVAGLGLSLYTGGWVQSVAGGLAGYALIAGLAAFWRSQRGYEGIGLGDAKLLAAGGFWVGVLALPVILLVASILGLVIALIMATATRSDDMSVAIPFGPFLALGTWAAWCGTQNLFVN